MDGIIDTTVRSVLLYMLIIIVLRLTGKKGLTQSTLTDFVLILVITKAAYNDSGLEAGIGMIIALSPVNYLFEYLT
jgi:uncharacterized membrane protein YcaP (DUF421 family)